MKRTILLLLAVITLSGSMSAFAQEREEYLTRLDAVEEIVKALYLAGGETSFTFEDYYCLHPDNGGYVHFVPDGNMLEQGYPLLCELYASVDGCGFSDISDENNNLSVFVTLAKAMGIVNGCGDNTFRPGKLVTYNEAVKMLMCAFGSYGLGEIRGDYPDGYIKAAEEAGITAGITFGGNDTVSYKDFSVMLGAALRASSVNIQNLSKMFIPPITPSQCIHTYADAFMNRDGAMQFALYGDELKNAARDGFESFNWVTGVSSPWVSGFDINQINGLEFEIIFHYATSTGPSDDVPVKLLLCQVGGIYRIENLEN